MLDVGCGSSRIIGALPPGSVAVDVLLRKLRYDRRFGRPRVQGSGFSLPFADASFPCVLCSQVIEHVPKESPILGELVRVLRPGGRLVLGTPDYANWEWVVTEWLYGKVAPGAYADEHIAHYTREELVGRFAALGFTHEATRYILRGELILAFRKREQPLAAAGRLRRRVLAVELGQLLFLDGDFDALVLDVDAQPAEQAHVHVGDADQREEGDADAAPVVEQQPVAGHGQRHQRHPVAEAVLAREDIEELAGEERAAGLARRPRSTRAARGRALRG